MVCFRATAAATFLAFLLMLIGCASKQPALRYHLRGGFVIPPDEPPPDASTRLRSARTPRKKGCDVPGETLAVRWSGRTALVRTSGLGMDQSGRMPLVLLKSIDDFRDALGRLESNGCLRPGEAASLLTRLTQQLALPSSVAYELAHASSPFQGYVDIERPLQLKLVNAVRKDGKITGFETVRYAVTLGTVKLLSAGMSAPGEPGSRLHIPARTKYLRLFFLTRRSPADHDAILLAAPDRNAQAAATESIKQQGEDYCRSKPVQVTCVDTPPDAGISAELPIRVNGALVGVPVRGTVRDIFRECGIRDPSPHQIDTLRITRPYNGVPIPIQFDSSKRDILGLVLIGGEEVTWQ